MTPPGPGVRPARPDEWQPLGRLLGEAFQDDPVWEWMCPVPRRRRAHLGRMFGQLIRRPMASGWVMTTDDHAGAAAWTAPGQWKVRPVDGLRISESLVRAIGPTRLRSRLRALGRMDRHHPTEPHWYLEVIGTDPAQRGRGTGGAMIEPMLERIDGEGLPVYLESSKERNLAFYHRFGFDVLDEVRLDPECPPMWLMWRPAR